MRRDDSVSRIVNEYERSSKARMLKFGPVPKDATTEFTAPEAMGKIEQKAKKDRLIKEMNRLAEDRADPTSKFFGRMLKRGGRRSGAGAAPRPLPVSTPKP